MAKAPKKRGWGGGSIRERRGKFQVRWREDGERCSLSGFLTRFEAQDELERIQARVRLGQKGVEPKVAPAVLARPREFHKLLDEWVEYRVKHGKRMALEERSRWALHLAGPLATQTLESVTPRWVRELAVRLVRPEVDDRAPDGSKKQPVSGPTAHRALTLLSSFYSWAVDEDLVTTNPARVALRHKDVKKLLASKHDSKAQPYLKSWDDVMRLYRALAQPYGIAYLISARAGLRPGEVLGLQWGDVDLEACTLQVERQVRSGKLGPTKSGKPRTVPIVSVLAKELKTWKESTDKRLAPGKIRPTNLVCPPPSRVKKNGRRGATYGTYLGPKSLVDALATAFEETKIKPASFYEYGRHTFGSLSALGGLSTWRLQGIMGHADIKTTLRYVSLVGQQLTGAELIALGD